MSDKLSFGKGFCALWARISLCMLAVPWKDNQKEEKEVKEEMEENGKEEKDRRVVILEVPLDLGEKVYDGVVPIQLRSILALWPALHWMKFIKVSKSRFKRKRPLPMVPEK